MFDNYCPPPGCAYPGRAISWSVLVTEETVRNGTGCGSFGPVEIWNSLGLRNLCEIGLKSGPHFAMIYEFELRFAILKKE